VSRSVLPATGSVWPSEVVQLLYWSDACRVAHQPPRCVVRGRGASGRVYREGSRSLRSNLA
jgi:hypothetical protein